MSSHDRLYGRSGSDEHARLRRACRLLLRQRCDGELVVLLDEVAWFLDTATPGEPLNPVLHERLHQIAEAAITALDAAGTASTAREPGGGR